MANQERRNRPVTQGVAAFTPVEFGEIADEQIGAMKPSSNTIADALRELVVEDPTAWDNLPPEVQAAISGNR